MAPLLFPIKLVHRRVHCVCHWHDLAGTTLQCSRVAIYKVLSAICPPPAKQSVEYIFKLLDVDKTGKLDCDVLRYFLKGILRDAAPLLNDKPVKIEDVGVVARVVVVRKCHE